MTSDSASKPPLPNLSTIDRYISPRYQESTQRRDGERSTEHSLSLLNKSKKSLSFAGFGINSPQFSNISKRIVFMNKDQESDNSENYRTLENLPNPAGVRYQIETSIAERDLVNCKTSDIKKLVENIPDEILHPSNSYK